MHRDLDKFRSHCTNSSSPCHSCCVQLEQLCEQSTGLDVNAACGAAGRTALHAAADAGCAAGVRALLGLGADSYCADDSGTSPLMLAAAGGHREAVKVSIPLVRFQSASN
jgi:ankyrin repeat protein